MRSLSDFGVLIPAFDFPFQLLAQLARATRAFTIFLISAIGRGFS